MKILQFKENFFKETTFFRTMNSILPLFQPSKTSDINQNSHTYLELCIIELHKKADNYTNYQIKNEFKRALIELHLIDENGEIENKETAIPIIKSVIGFTPLGYEGPVQLNVPDKVYEVNIVGDSPST